MRSRRVYLGHDIPAYRDRLLSAIARYGLPPGTPHAWCSDPDFQVVDYLRYMQPSAAMYWQCYLFAALQAADVDKRADLSTITLLDRRWHFGEWNWTFNPTQMQYQVRHALAGLNYIVAVEFEVYRNLHHWDESLSDGRLSSIDRGRLIASHLQGFIWGKFPSVRQRRLFLGGLFNAPGIKVVGVHNLAGALRYTGKPPYRGRSVFLQSSGRRARRPWPEMSLTLHHLLLSRLHRYSCPELTFAGGEGSMILADAKRLWRDYNPGSTHSTDNRPPLLSGLVKRRYR